MRKLERIAAFCTLSGFVLGLTADHLLGKIGFDAALMPEVFKSASLPASSLKELAGGSEKAAVATALRAVSKQPLSVEALAVLARSSMVLKPHMSSEALAQAAALGWRDVVVQAAVIETAASVRNWAVVGPRLLALTRLDRLDAIDTGGFSTADAREYAPKIAHAFLGDGISWLKFAMWLRDIGREKDSKYLLSVTPSFNREDECAQLGLVANEFVRKGEIQFSAELVDSRCQAYLTSTSHGLSIDQNFGDIRRGPFEWRVRNQPGIGYDIKSNGGKVRLEIVNSDPLPRLFASKILEKKYISYRNIMYSIDNNFREKKGRQVKMLVSCIDRQGSNSEFRSISDLEAVVDCDFLRVNFWIPTGRSQVWVR